MMVTQTYSMVRYDFFRIIVPINITGNIFELLNNTWVGYVKKSHEAFESPTVPTEHAANITYADSGATRSSEVAADNGSDRDLAEALKALRWAYVNSV